MPAEPNRLHPAADPDHRPDRGLAGSPIPHRVPGAANSTRPTAPFRPYAGRPPLPDGGVRLVPLDSFVWGGRPAAGGRRCGRTRGDHCLIRVVDGTMRIILPNGAVDHGAGSVVFIPAGTAFATDPLPGVSGQVLLMRRDTAGRLDVTLPNRIVVDSGAGDAISADLGALAARFRDPIATATAACGVELIAASLHRMAARPDTDDGGLRRPPDSRALVAEFCELAGREMGRGRTLSDLAEALGTTAGGLDDACRRHRGCSALDLIYRLRTERAVTQLRETSRPIADIAIELGFSSLAHMIRCFVAATGRTPEAFRQMERHRA